jgi:hypothetical protein
MWELNSTFISVYMHVRQRLLNSFYWIFLVRNYIYLFYILICSWQYLTAYLFIVIRAVVRMFISTEYFMQITRSLPSSYCNMYFNF